MQKSLRFFACIAALLMAAFTLQAQTPQKFSYQAVVRNASNQLVRNATVGVRISIFQTTAGGTLKFQETHTPTTNDNGLFSIEIGGGTIVSGAINTIDWGDGPYFLRSEVDPLGGTAYTLVADQQLLAVPYALHCDEYQNLEDVLRQNNHAGMVQLKSVKDPTDDQDAVTKHYLDSIVALVSTLTASHVKDTAVSRCGSFTWNRTGQTYTSTGIYLYTLTNACGAGCDTVISLRLTIVQNPSVTLGNIISSVGTSSCAGAIAALTANVTDHTGNLTYTWTKTAGATLASDNTMTVNTNALTSGDNSYHLVVTAAVDGCGSANASEDITISASAASAVTLNEITSSNGTTLCAGGATNLTASAATSTGTVSYVWTATPDATAGLSATTGNIVTATPTTATSYTYTVSATAHQDGCADANASKEITITAVEAPAVALGVLSASTGNTICVGETPDLSLSAGTSEGTVSYAWTASPAANSGLTDDNVDHLTVAPTAAGTYTYTVTATASKAYGGCTNADDSKSVTITVNGTPALTLGNIKSNNTAKTVDGLNTPPHTLEANITNPDPLPGTGISYQWYKNNSIMAGETDATLSITTGGVYKVRVTYDNGSCSVYQESEITICETPTVPEIELTSGNASMCAGNSATLAVTAGTYNAAYAYTWSPSTGLNTATGQTVTASPTSTTTYTVTASSGTGCSTYDQTSAGFDITITNLTTPAITGSTAICPDSYSTLSVSSPVDGYTYHWYKGSDEVATGTSYNATTAGTYKVNATKDGCTSDFSNSITTSVTSITSTLAFTGTPYSGGTSSNIPVQVSATLNGASNLGYDWEIVSSTAAGAEIRNGTYSYQKNVYATGAGSVNIRCTMHVSKDGCTKDVVANTSVTVNSCSVSISSLSVAKWESSGKTCQNIPFAMVANYSVTPADATLTWQWKRGSSSSYLSNITSTYAKAGANKSKCYIIETSAGSTGTTYWYQVELTASKDGCSTTRTSSAVNVLVSRSQTSGSPTTTGATTSKAGTTLTFTAKSAHSYVIWSAIPNESYVEASNPSNLLWKNFTASSSSAGSGTATIPSSATGTIYYYNSKSSSATCPLSSGSYQGTSVQTKSF